MTIDYDLPVTQAPAVPVQPAPVASRPAQRRAARPRLQIDPAAGFGPVTGSIAGALGVLAVGSVGHVANWPPAVGILSAGVLALFSLLSARLRNYTVEALAFRFFGHMLAGLWLFAAWWSTPWAPLLLLPLGLAAAGMGSVAFIARRRRTAAELEAARQAAAERIHDRDRRALEWEQRIERVGSKQKFAGVRIVNIADWESGDGFTIDGDCPPGGTGWRDLAAITTDLAQDARLPSGCDLEADEGVNQGAFLLHVPIRDTFADYQLTDEPIEAATVMNGIDLGPTRTRERAVVPIRESATLIVSDPGGGKTTLLHRFVLKLAMCTDGLSPIIDMNNGAMGVAWCEAWWDGEAPYPVVPAIAGDAVEAHRLTKFFVGVALGRKKRSGPLKMKTNQSLMPIGNGAPGEPPPLIVPIYDESAELVGADASLDEAEGLDEWEMQELVKKTMAASEKTLRVARDAGIRPVYSALRAVDGFIPTGLLAMCANRIALRLPTDADYGNLFGWVSGNQKGGPIRKGVGKFALGMNQPTTAFAAPDLTPQQIREYSIKIAEAGIGPYDLTPEDIADGEAYAGVGTWTQRWDRAEKLFGRPRREYVSKAEIAAVPAAAVAMVESSSAEEPQPDGPMPDLASGMSGLFSDLDKMQADLDALLADDAPTGPVEGEAVPAVEQPDAEVADEADAAQLAKLYELWALPTVDPTQQQEEPIAAAWQDRLVQLLNAAKGEGASPTALADQLKKEGRSTTRQTVQDWCTEESKKDGGPVVKLKRGTYALRKHVPDADE